MTISVALPDDLRARVESMRRSMCLDPRAYGLPRRPSTSDLVRLALESWADRTPIRTEHMELDQ